MSKKILRGQHNGFLCGLVFHLTGEGRNEAKVVILQDLTVNGLRAAILPLKVCQGSNSTKKQSTDKKVNIIFSRFQSQIPIFKAVNRNLNKLGNSRPRQGPTGRGPNQFGHNKDLPNVKRQFKAITLMGIKICRLSDSGQGSRESSTGVIEQPRNNVFESKTE